jgi:hypothetical protein
MSPDAIKEVATSTIDAMKSQPLMLALIVLQVIVLAAITYSTLDRQRANSEQFRNVVALLQQCLQRTP